MNAESSLVIWNVSQTTKPAKKKNFIPSMVLLESLSSYTVCLLKNEDCKKVFGKFPMLSCDTGHPLMLWNNSFPSEPSRLTLI